MGVQRILVVRLGAMGDIIHTLPAVATLKRRIAGVHTTWVVEPRWAPLLESNPDVDVVLHLDRANARGIRNSFGNLRRQRCDTAVDFQGLLKSAITARLSGAARVYGFAHTRERLATVFYSEKVYAQSAHVVDRNVELALSLGGGSPVIDFPLPSGWPEGDLPSGPFVLASPLAGWGAKQWPLTRYADLARLLDVPLVLNGPPSAREALSAIKGAVVHCSGLAGLIDATRRASAVVGVDSGPIHLAAALQKPGVAIFGPTDPARNGPYGSSIEVLRAASASTTYKRASEPDSSMQSISAVAVHQALQRCGCLT